MVSSFCRYSQVIASNKTVCFLIKCIFIQSFIMLYAENIGLRDYSGFLQIGSHTVNRERFAGLNFHVFCSFQEHPESFPVNIHFIIL